MNFEPPRRPRAPFAAWFARAMALAICALCTPIAAADGEPTPAVEPAPAPAATTAAPAAETAENGEKEGEGEAAKTDETSTYVPPLEYNYSSRANSWSFDLPASSREPFSFSRKVREKPTGDRPKGPDGITPPDNTKIRITEFFTGLQPQYREALDQFAAAIQALADYQDDNQHDKQLTDAKIQLNGCLEKLGRVQQGASELPRDQLTPEQQQVLIHYQSATNTLARAAKQKLSTVSLRLRFNQEVLRQDDFYVAAIQAHRENPTWTYAAVLFKGYPNPCLVGSIVKGKAVGSDLELKILSLTPKKVTVLFQHQATFEIPVTRQAAVTTAGRGN